MKIELTPKNALIISSIVSKYSHLFDITTLYADGDVYKSIIKPEKYVDKDSVFDDIAKELDRHASELNSFKSPQLVFNTKEQNKYLHKLSEEIMYKVYGVPSLWTLKFLSIDVQSGDINDGIGKYLISKTRELQNQTEKSIWQALVDISEDRFYDNFNIK